MLIDLRFKDGEIPANHCPNYFIRNVIVTMNNSISCIDNIFCFRNGEVLIELDNSIYCFTNNF